MKFVYYLFFDINSFLFSLCRLYLSSVQRCSWTFGLFLHSETPNRETWRTFAKFPQVPYSSPNLWLELFQKRKQERVKIVNTTTAINTTSKREFLNGTTIACRCIWFSMSCDQNEMCLGSSTGTFKNITKESWNKNPNASKICEMQIFVNIISWRWNKKHTKKHSKSLFIFVER